MKWMFPVSVAAIAMMAGCQAQQPKPATQGAAPTASVLDVTAPRTVHEPSVYAISPSVPRALPASYAGPTSYAPTSGGPEYLPPGADASYMPPPASASPAGAPVRAAVSAKGKPARTSGKTYVVKHGDTLFRIAREQYGSGGEWRRIAQANPGLTPATLKAGQRLVMP